LCQRPGQIDRRLDRPPAIATPAAMFGDTVTHLVVEGLAGRDIDPGGSPPRDDLLGMPAFAGACTADNEREMGQIGDDGDPLRNGSLL
jgi:hypothetical protein